MSKIRRSYIPEKYIPWWEFKVENKPRTVYISSVLWKFGIKLYVK